MPSLCTKFVSLKCRGRVLRQLTLTALRKGLSANVLYSLHYASRCDGARANSKIGSTLQKLMVF